MRPLAEFIMRGRFQAALIAALGNFVPFLSNATVGLVALRQGTQEALLVMLWAAMPLLLTGFATPTTMVISSASMAALLLTVLVALTLKATQSWSTSLVLATLASLIASLAVGALLDPQLLAVEQKLAEFFAQAAAKADAQAGLLQVTRPMLLGVLGYMVLLTVLISLLWSRWWQAMLYNPGGFKSEMHQLRIGLYPAGVLLITMIVVYGMSQEYLAWATLLATPLLVAGLCLAHYAVASLSLGVHWLVLLYIGVVLFSPVSLILVGVGFADSVLNLRLKIPKKGSL